MTAESGAAAHAAAEAAAQAAAAVAQAATEAQDAAAEEADAERQIRDTFKQVETWHRTPLFEPIPGAQLRADDAQWPYLALSQLAKAGLDVAAEHLFAIKTLSESAAPFTMAYRSILRTALVGATQAVWLLAPADPDERVRRQRILLAEMYHRHGQYLGDLLALNDLQGTPRDENTQEVFDHVFKRESQIGILRAFANEKATWNDTDAIREAAKAIWGEQPKAAELVAESQLEWRAGSGVAHGLIWPLLGSARTKAIGPADKHSRAVIEASGSYLRIINHYMLAHRMTAAGWDLLRRRGL